MTEGSMATKTVAVHRLVCTEFHPNPNNKPEVNHIDFNQLNNHKDNLEWVTAKENMAHYYSSSKYVRKKKYSDEFVAYVKENIIKKGCKQLSKELGLSYAAVYELSGVRLGRYDNSKKIINTQTGEIYKSATELSLIIGQKVKEIRRQLSGERYNHTPFRYVGKEHIQKEKAAFVRPVIKNPIAVFDTGWKLLGEFINIPEAERALGKKFGNVSSFLNGKSEFVGGCKFKKIAPDGTYIEPIPFASKKKPLKIKPPKQPNTPPKKVYQYDKEGNLLQVHESMKKAAKSMGMGIGSLRKQIRTTGNCRQFLCKFS